MFFKSLILPILFEKRIYIMFKQIISSEKINLLIFCSGIFDTYKNLIRFYNNIKELYTIKFKFLLLFRVDTLSMLPTINEKLFLSSNNIILHSATIILINSLPQFSLILILHILSPTKI